MLVDTHAHLYDTAFAADLPDVLERAAVAGVSRVITLSETLADAQRNLELAAQFPAVGAGAGLYPTELDLPQAEALIALIRQEHSRLCAIGEVGLDYWLVKEPSELEVQRAIFDRFIALALDVDLPLNVHSRSAGRHAIAMLLERGATRVQIHAFDGKAANAMPAVEAGYFFSIPPSINRSPQKQKLVKQLPLTCLLVETDSPVCGPDPQARNEPANVLLVIDAIAEVKRVPQAEVLAVIAENTQRLYGAL
jgi:TatD DNase family protein